MKMKKYPGRINKSEARRRWNNDENFVIVPCKCRPFDMFGDLGDFAYLVIPEIEKTNYRTFEIFLDSFSYYNCNSVCGLYPSFYVKNN